MHTTLPPSLIASLDDAPGFDAAAFAAIHASGKQVTSLRINPAKIPAGELPATGALGAVQSRIPWSSYGYYLQQRPSFTLDPLLHAGCYYVQEASSMFIEQALTQTMDLSQPVKVLDLCAAPGGKSTLIQSIISNDSLLVSNEVIKSRSTILQENITKWGGSNAVVTSNDPRDFARLENYFDIIVIDAPCSGSGLFRRDPAAIGEWSEANVLLCSQRQQRIAADAWPALKRDGVLVYCTCSYSVQEDEAVVDWLCGQFAAQGLPLTVDPSLNIVESFTSTHDIPCYRFYPDKVKGEGFFLACLQKKEGGEARISSKQKTEKLPKQEWQLATEWIAKDAPVHLFRHKEEVIAVPPGFEAIIPVLQERLYLRQAGITIGKSAKDGLIPGHALAVSGMASRSIPVLALGLEQALQYLRKDELPAGTAHKGWALVEYEGFALGWVKILSNRVNNYYPKEWRILQHLKNP